MFKEQANMCPYKQKHLLANLTNGYKSVVTQLVTMWDKQHSPPLTNKNPTFMEIKKKNYIA
jgi:hypothetical protein